MYPPLQTGRCEFGMNENNNVLRGMDEVYSFAIAKWKAALVLKIFTSKQSNT